jgi:hypothetical protein
VQRGECRRVLSAEALLSILPAGLRSGSRYRKFFDALGEELIAFVEHDARFGTKLSDGASISDHQKSAARQFALFGKMKAAEALIIEPPQRPRELDYLWRWFEELSCGLPVSGLAPAAVTWEAVDSWSRLRRIVLDPHEAWALVRLGTARFNVLAEEERKRVEAAKRGGQS